MLSNALIYLNMIFLTITVTQIIDISGIIDNVKTLVAKLLHIDNNKVIRLKPFDCSYCMSFWAQLFYLICVSEVSIFNIMVALLFAYLTPQIQDVIRLLGDIITKITNIIYEKVQ